MGGSAPHSSQRPDDSFAFPPSHLWALRNWSPRAPRRHARLGDIPRSPLLSRLKLLPGKFGFPCRGQQGGRGGPGWQQRRPSGAGGAALTPHLQDEAVRSRDDQLGRSWSSLSGPELGKDTCGNPRGKGEVWTVQRMGPSDSRGEGKAVNQGMQERVCASCDPKGSFKGRDRHVSL